MLTYYNDIDPYCCEWLSNLISAKHLPGGVIDPRSIKEISADDLREFSHVDFFAGIGGWGLAKRLAGWRTDWPIWTASLPCQPFSVAGACRGEEDERHLWPVFRNLVEECEPRIIVGEQVASASAREWADRVRMDLEELGYAFAACILPAASVGAPHIRERMWWVADSGSIGYLADKGNVSPPSPSLLRPAGSGSNSRWMAYNGEREGANGSGRLADTGGRRLGKNISLFEGVRLRERESAASTGSDAESRNMADSNWESNIYREDREDNKKESGSSGNIGNSWGVYFRRYSDGIIRRTPIEPELYPVVDGIPKGVGRMRPYGNAIVPQVGASFLRAIMDIINEDSSIYTISAVPR